MDAWNKWRDENPDIRPDLSGADLSGWNLRGADLSEANLVDANLIGADLRDSTLFKANLFEAYLIAAKLGSANFHGAPHPGPVGLVTAVRKRGRRISVVDLELTQAEPTAVRATVTVGIPEEQSEPLLWPIR